METPEDLTSRRRGKLIAASAPEDGLDRSFLLQTLLSHDRQLTRHGTELRAVGKAVREVSGEVQAVGAVARASQTILHRIDARERDAVQRRAARAHRFSMLLPLLSALFMVLLSLWLQRSGRVSLTLLTGVVLAVAAVLVVPFAVAMSHTGAAHGGPAPAHEEGEGVTRTEGTDVGGQAYQGSAGAS